MTNTNGGRNATTLNPVAQSLYDSGKPVHASIGRDFILIGHDHLKGKQLAICRAKPGEFWTFTPFVMVDCEDALDFQNTLTLFSASPFEWQITENTRKHCPICKLEQTYQCIGVEWVCFKCGYEEWSYGGRE